MKLSKITAFFCIGTPICIALRIFQVLFTIELKTGFYTKEYEVIGKAISAVILAFFVLLYLFCFKYYKLPEKPPKQNIALSISAIGLAAVTAVQSFFDIGITLTSAWQIIIIQIIGIIATLYFIWFAISKYINKTVSSLIHIIPCIFMILRTVFVFIDTSDLAHITDNLLIIATYCVVMVFFVNFAKFYNGVDSDKNFKKLLASGLVSVSLCFTQSIPHIVVNILSNNGYLHVSHIANISVLVMGIFILVFLISYFVLNKND